MTGLSFEYQENLQVLIEQWLKQEEEGVQFPVDFDVAWKIAGYCDKATGKRKLVSKKSFLKQDQDYQIEKGIFRRSTESELCGRSSDLIKMTCDAFKHFCLLAQTETGHKTRQYFIECEKKLRSREKAATDSNTLKNLIKQELANFIENEIFSKKIYHTDSPVSPSIQQISELLDAFLTKTPEHEATNIKLLLVAHYYPELQVATHVVSAVNRLYARSGALLTVAELTEIIKQRYPKFPYWHNGLVQMILVKCGFQERVANNAYAPTEKGVRFSDRVDGQLLWYSDILCIECLVGEFTRLNESD
ncbi:hypothetical protein [Anabaena sp. PCC 7108]|uniref:hypothetical protein n=1 Tax=Anabaena sp. PCC 7108 TaxID=163908 RepID=UPI000348B5E9|nr:hypothetical protein [Anabaena sp. PCC 7108]